MKLLVILLIALVLSSCGKKQELETKPSSADSGAKSVLDFSYQITKESFIDSSNNWGSVTVEVSRKITNDEITVLANRLREAESKYRNLTIGLRLVGTSDSGPGYATVLYDPELKVERWGSTDEEQQRAALLAKQNLKGKIIGKWHEDQYLPGTYVFIERDGKTYLREIFERGITGPGSYSPSSNDDMELIKRKVHGATRFYEKDGRPDEYYIINSKGNLDFYDVEGYVTTGTKIP